MREPVDRSEQRWQPVLVDFTVSVKEHDDDSLGLQGTDVSGPDEALTFPIANQTDLKQDRSRCKRKSGTGNKPGQGVNGTI